MSYSTLTIVALTLLSTTMLLAIVVAKMLRDEKRRSDARVAMLAAMAAEAAAYAPPEEQEDDYEGAHENAAFQAEADELPLAYEYTPTIATDMFTARAEPSAWPKRLAVAGALAGVGFAIVIGAKSGAFNRDASPAAAPAAAQPAASAAPQTQLPLDLLSLKQSQEAKTLTITGLVQNPRAGAELSNVAATAFVFGADGSFLASGRAPLDFTVLRPGDESGFVITVPVTSPVARYRVGFRGEDGHVIGHVDRRSSGTIARGPS